MTSHGRGPEENLIRFNHLIAALRAFFCFLFSWRFYSSYHFLQDFETTPELQYNPVRGLSRQNVPRWAVSHVLHVAKQKGGIAQEATRMWRKEAREFVTNAC